MALAATVAAAALTALIGIILLAYFSYPWFRRSVRNPDNFPHYLTTIFTLGLAVFACYAWLESRRGTAALEGQLNDMERPFVWVVKLEQPIYDDAGRQFLWTWACNNIGKGLAYGYRASELDH
jgi:uncharacterized membrane protein YbhN (UPF0104 family)